MLHTTHKFLLVFSLVSISHSFCAQTTTTSTPVHHYHMEPTYHYDPVITSEIHPHVTTELHPNIIVSNTSELSVKMSEISMQCMQAIKETMTPENYHFVKDLITQTLWDYRYAIACGTIVGSYGITSLLLLTDYYHYLQNDTLWARWKPELTFELLCTMPQKNLTQELLATINERNYNKNNPTDFAHPLTMFLISIDTEIKICKRYIATTQAIKRLRLMAIFPTNDNKLNEINKLLERALFIKHLFLSWLSDYNTGNKKEVNV